MSSEQDKALTEIPVFKEFVEKAQLSIRPESIKKPGGKSDPDIFCTFHNGEDVAFELVEICASDVAALISKVRKTNIDGLINTSDPTYEVVQKKIIKSNNYKTLLPIELLCYTSARVVSPDDTIIAEAIRCADSIDGRFRKIWLLGAKGVYEVWKAP